MKFAQASIECIKSESPILQIERIGRTCYKSEDKISQGTAVKFVNNMIKNKHYAMLEHGVVTYKVTPSVANFRISPEFLSTPYLKWTKYAHDYFLTVSLSHLVVGMHAVTEDDVNIINSMTSLFQLNYFQNRAVNNEVDERYQIDINPDISELPPEVAEIHTFYSFKFNCDRAVSHELVRHRCSVAQSSQRYCGYDKEKFGGQITYIIPPDFDEWNINDQNTFIMDLETAEDAYLRLRNSGKPAEIARGVLPNATMTEVILTANVPQWRHFLNLRSFGTTGKPHPHMKYLADQVLKYLESEGYNFTSKLT